MRATTITKIQVQIRRDLRTIGSCQSPILNLNETKLKESSFKRETKQ